MLRVAVIVVASLLVCGSAAGQPVSLGYDAGATGAPVTAPDPTASGWIADIGTDPGLTAFDVSPDVGFGVNAWGVSDDTAGAGQFITYSLPMSTDEHTFANAEGWRFRVVYRMVDALGTVAPGSVCQHFQYGQLDDGDRRWLIFMGVDAAGDLMLRTFGGNGADFVITTGGTALDDYHEIIMQSTSPGTDDVTVIADGVVLQTNYTGEVTAFASDGPAWGTGSSAGRGVGNWAQLEFETDACVAPQVTCGADCDTGDATVEITAIDDLSSYTLTADDGVNPPVVLTGAALAAGGSVIETFVGLPDGVYDVVVSSDCAGTTVLSNCRFVIADVDPNDADIVLCREGVSDIDSCAAIVAALIDQGQEPIVIGSIDELPCAALLGEGSVVWTAYGTWPDHACVSAAEADTLITLLENGVSLYLEGGDLWGFCGATALRDYDGVAGLVTDGNVMIDGDDTFLAMIGLSHGALDVTGLDAVYNQDQTASDWTDQLLPTGTAPYADDAVGTDAGVIWDNDVTGGGPAYATAVFTESLAPYGRVLAQSWEFGGYGGDQAAIMGLYRDALVASSTGGVEFRRGDVNGDQGFDISDAVFALASLFVPLSPAPECADASDVNDDGGFDVSDPVFALSALFVPMFSPPPSPGPANCGVDPTPDALDCVASCP